MSFCRWRKWTRLPFLLFVLHMQAGPLWCAHVFERGRSHSYPQPLKRIQKITGQNQVLLLYFPSTRLGHRVFFHLWKVFLIEDWIGWKKYCQGLLFWTSQVGCLRFWNEYPLLLGLIIITATAAVPSSTQMPSCPCSRKSYALFLCKNRKIK